MAFTKAQQRMMERLVIPGTRVSIVGTKLAEAMKAALTEISNRRDEVAFWRREAKETMENAKERIGYLQSDIEEMKEEEVDARNDRAEVIGEKNEAIAALRARAAPEGWALQVMAKGQATISRAGGPGPVSWYWAVYAGDPKSYGEVATLTEAVEAVEAYLAKAKKKKAKKAKK